MPLWDNIVEVAGLLVSALVLWLFRILLVKYNQTKFYDELYKALEIGVTHAQEEFVDWAKKASADGTLSKDERAQALTLAVEKAKEFANNTNVKNALSELAKEQIQVLVRKILDKKAATK